MDKQCPKCRSHGRVICKLCDGEGSKPCPACDATGYCYCSFCNGSGWVAKSVTGVPIDPPMKCVLCNGTGGKRICSQCNGQNRLFCPECLGQGTETCDYCYGRGFVS